MDADSLLSPFILFPNLFLLLRGETRSKCQSSLLYLIAKRADPTTSSNSLVGDIEELSDLLWRLAFDHICDSLTSDVPALSAFALARS